MRIVFGGAAAVGAAVAVLSLGGAAPASAGSGWQPTGSMTAGRNAHLAAALHDGRVLAISGLVGSAVVPGAELFQPASGTWSVAADPLVPRYYATATTLRNGRVLLVGGRGSAGVTNHAELYDPVADTWTATGAMTQVRSAHAAVLLDDGRVLVAGGADGANVASATAEIYTPATGTWSPAGTFPEGRQGHQMLKLPDGRVLVVGGFGTSEPLTYRASAAIYDPPSNSWAPAASMAVPRTQAAGGVLPDGSVLISGGANGGGYAAGSERFDPTTNSWTAAGTSGIVGSFSVGATLRDGRFLIAADGSRSTPIFDSSAPSTSAWTTAHETGTRRVRPSLTMLDDGRVLIAGGIGEENVPLASAELFTPPTVRGSTGGDFGAVDVGDAREQDITLSNDGGYSLWIEGISVAGPGASDFAVLADECAGETLDPDETCVVRVRFAPSSAGSRHAELAVDDNAETSPAVELTGEGRTKPVDPPVDPSVDPPVNPPVGPPLPPGIPTPPMDAPSSVPVGCTRPYVALVGIDATGGAKAPRARLTGLATPSLAGSTVTVRRGSRKVGSATVTTGGRIAISVPAPRNARVRDTARYRLEISSSVRSAALKATRRVGTARHTTLGDGRVRVDGRVAGIRRPTTLQVRSTPVCGPKVTGTRVRTDAKGRFRVTVAAPPSGVPAVVHRVWLQKRSVTLPIVVTAAS